jgi:hypothetical protein
MGLAGLTSPLRAQSALVDPYVRRLGFAFPGTPEVGTLLGAQGLGVRLSALPTGEVAVAPDPVTISFGTQMAAPFYQWFHEASLVVQNAPGTYVQIVATNAANQELYRLSLQRTRVARVIWPRLAVNSTELLRFGAVLLPETASYRYVGGSTGSKPFVTSAKSLTANRFRLAIQGLEAPTAQATRIDAFSMNLIPLPGGDPGSGAIDPLRLELPATAAEGFFRWQSDLLAGRGSQRTGVLQFLSADGSQVSGQARLSGLSVLGIDIAPSSAGDRASAVAGSVLVSLNCRAVELDPASFAG